MPSRPRFEDRLEELLSDASTSEALLQMILLSLDRDPLDALADAEVLVDLLHRRFDALREAPPTAGKPALVLDLRARLEASRAQRDTDPAP
jgi:hypothetical protein